MKIRIGHGYDVHAFGAGDHVVLGGVRIPYERGLIAHSDGDVVIHALCDALLGACALGDIGKHFPDTDAAFAKIDSRELLRNVVAKLNGLGYSVINADMTVLAQAPKLAPHIENMCGRLAMDLKVSIDDVNVKATTTEELGFVGRKEGIAAYAVVLLQGSVWKGDVSDL
jgi:2-C-methyl-D-erythritol 2,4-cyclodiphosphate synthase